MKNNKKKTRMTKIEKRRLAFEKRNVKKEMNLARYGAEGGSALVMAKTTEFNRRVIAAVLALVFVLTTLVVGVNIVTKADDNTDPFNMQTKAEDGIVVSKGLKNNGNGTYDIKMEAYATAKTSTEQLAQDTPLDIVMVLAQAKSMKDNKDVFKGNYPSDNESFSIDEATGKYYLDPDDNQKYVLSYKTVYKKATASSSEPYGDVKTSWTAQEAAEWVESAKNNSVQGDGKLYYPNGNNYEEVKWSKDYYRNVGNSVRIYGNFTYDATKLGNTWNLISARESSGGIDNSRQPLWTYTVKANGEPFWHKIYSASVGSFLEGYYLTLYYYTNAESGSAVSGNRVDSYNSSGYNTAVSNGTITLMGTGKEGYGWTWGGGNWTGSASYYTHGDMYVPDTSSKYVKLYTDSTTLAWPLPGSSTETTSYGEELYTLGYQLYYIKGTQEIPVGEIVYKTSDIAYSVNNDNPSLYEDVYVTRQEAQKEAASKFAEAVAEKATETGADHRIAVVGYATDGTILTGEGIAKEALLPVNENDNNDNKVNDGIDSAINGLTADGGNNLASGLESAISIFDANSDDRKRIVVVFTDDTALDSNAQNTALSRSATMKDTCGASVYVVGLNTNQPNDFLSKLSSDYFATNTNQIEYIVNTDGKAYYHVATDCDSLNTVFERTIADSIRTSTTTTCLTSNAVLKDIISDNFILPSNPDSHITLQTIKGVYNSSGTPDFSTVTNNPQGITASFGTGANEHTLSVTGFDFSNNYIAQDHTPGQKLVVTIKDVILKKGVTSKEYDENGFMKIPSNTVDSGIYKNDSAEKATAYFPVPYALIDPYATEKNGMYLSKRISLNDDTSYSLKLDAYSTGQTITEQIPTDYVLVVDQSGSMSTKDVPESYNATGITKDWKVTDGKDAYYYKETDSDGVDHYYRVYQKRGDMFEYHAQDTVYTGDCIEDLSWFQSEEVQEMGAASEYWYNPSLDDSGSREGSATDNHMYPVRISSQGGFLTYWIRFRFTDINGTTYGLKYPNQPWYQGPGGNYFKPGDRWGLVISYNTANAACKALSKNDPERYTYGEFLGINTGMYVRQVLFSRHVDNSQLAYKDDNGVEHLLIDATYCDANGKPIGGKCEANGVPSEDHKSENEAYWHGTLYTASATITRLDALKSAMKEFVETVASQGADHRVAIAGFSSKTGYNNTELLTGTDLTIQNNNGIQYTNLTPNNYKNALLRVTDSTNATLSQGKLTAGKLKDAIDALTADGGTEGEYGLNMAKGVLDNREETKFTPQGGGEQMDRLKIVVYFTDGTPGNYSDDNQYEYGNKVVEAAAKIKDSPTLMDTEIYSIGTFGFSDANPLVYPKYEGRSNSEYTFDPDYVQTIEGGFFSNTYMYRLWLRNTKGYGDVATDTVSDYMRTISSEYPSASKFVDASWYGKGTKSDGSIYTDMVSRVRGAASGGRHYFLCTDLTGLSKVFKTVASESSAASESFGENTIFRDTVDGTKFDYTNVTVTAEPRVIDVDGKEYGLPGSANPTIREWIWSDGSHHQISEDGVVEVTGVDYTEKAATAEHRGEKLVVHITGLVPKTTVVGDTVYSNTDNSGIYSGDRQIAPFAKPYIKRHSYAIDVGDQNKGAVFTITTQILDRSKNPVTGSLDGVVVTDPNGNRVKYTGAQTYSGMGNELPAFYYESIPEDYSVQTIVKTEDNEYTYYLWYDDESESDRRTLTSEMTQQNDFTFANHQIHVKSESNTKKVTLTETVSGEYASTEALFSPIVYLVPPSGVTVAAPKTYGDYEWDIDGDNNRLTTSLGEIKGDGNDSIVFDVPAGWTLVVSNATNDRYHTESYTINGGEPIVRSAPYEYTIPMDLDNSTIVINNTAENIPIEGILSANNHNWIIYILLAVGIVGVGIGVYFLWKKKDEFIEQ